MNVLFGFSFDQFFMINWYISVHPLIIMQFKLLLGLCNFFIHLFKVILGYRHYWYVIILLFVLVLVLFIPFEVTGLLFARGRRTIKIRILIWRLNRASWKQFLKPFGRFCLFKIIIRLDLILLLKFVIILVNVLLFVVIPLQVDIVDSLEVLDDMVVPVKRVVSLCRAVDQVFVRGHLLLKIIEL
jgi:hypothetical protein